jgi:hypothetical protein
MTSRPRLRLLLVAVAAAACDTGITPPADTPVLALSAREVAMFAPKGSTIPDTALVYVFNNGRGTLAGLTLTPPVYQDSATGWLSATLQDTTIILAASAEHLPLQTTYTATLGVVLAAADSSPRTITVMFEVGQTQQIALSDTSLAFGAILGGALPPPQTITVTNGGTGVLNELRDPTVTANWLSATLGSATAPAHVDVVPSAIPGLPGTYQALVVVSSRVAEPQSDTVQVTYVVAEPATLELAADTLALDAVEGAAPVVRHVRVREARLRPLDGLAVSAPTRGWLAASLVADSAPTALVITADPGALYTAADTARMVRDTARVTVTSGGGGSQTLLVTLQVRRGPTVRVSPNVVTLTMYRSGPAPPPQVVSVTNDGQGTLTGLDTVPGLPPWLTASFDTRTAPAALTLQVDSTGLAAGNYAGSVIVRSDAARWDTVNVRFTVRGGPSLAISSDAVTFRADSSGAVPHAVELLAGNAGPGVLRGWSISLAAPAPWLNWVLDSTQVPARLTLRPNVTTGLRRDTTYDATLSIAAATAGAASQTIAIRYALSDTLPTDSIWISPDSVSLVAPLDGSDLPSAVLGVTYAGPGRPAVASYPTWLTATRVEGDSGLVLGLSAIPSGSLPGTVLTGTVVISDPRSSADTVAVRLTIVGPAAALSADTVRFRAYQGQSPWPAAQRLLVANGGADTLKLLRIEGTVPPWLDATLQGTTAPTILNLQPRQLFAVPGSYTFAAVVSSQLGGVGKDTVRVVYDVDPGPTIAASPDRLRLAAVSGAGVPDADTAAVLNAGNGALGTLQQPVPDQLWLSARVDSSASPPTVLVAADPAGLTPGTRTGTVVLRSTQSQVGPDTLRVSFETVAPPTITRSPTVLAFHVLAGDPVPADTQAITVFDPAGRPTGSLGVSPSGDSAWLHVEPATGTAPATVRVWPIAVPEASDTAYSATIRILGSLAPDTLTATVKYYVELGRSPLIVLSRDSLTFDRPNPPAQTVKITNGGSGTLRDLSVRETTGADWLFVLFDSRIAPATLTVAVDPAKAADEPANSVALLEISGMDAQPRVIKVVLR